MQYFCYKEIERKSKNLKISRIILPLFFLAISVYGSDSISKPSFIYYPARLDTWEMMVGIGLSVTSLPIEVVEEEINQSPLLKIDYKLGLPANFSLNAKLFSNYIVNGSSMGFDYAWIDRKFSSNVGFDVTGWFGHLNMDAIQLKARGMIISPYVTTGIKFDNLLLSARIETQISTIWTDDYDEIILGKVKYPDKGIALHLTVEQPLWNDNWTALGIKLNYTKFYYQSWLSYNTLDEYLFYPEVIFSFVL